MKKNFMSHFNFLFYPFLVFALFSCGDAGEITENDKALNTQTKENAPEKIVPKKHEQLSDKPGGIGVFDVPEMLTLCIRDSASIQNMAASFASAYKILQEDISKLKLETNGSPGSIYYNNNPDNFVFECVYPISKMPSSPPEKSKIVVLEAANMYIYNYYGSYRYLYKAYEDIRYLLKQNGLEQNGPMREFYITDATLVKDTAQWFTRIMVPVVPDKKN